MPAKNTADNAGRSGALVRDLGKKTMKNVTSDYASELEKKRKMWGQE